MTRRAAGAIGVLVVGLAACEIDFVAIPEIRDAVVSVVSDQTDLLRAEVRVVHRGMREPVTVSLQGAEVPAVDQGGGRWTHEAGAVVDSLEPVVHLTTRVGDEDPIELEVPLLVRSGPAAWTHAGDLHLPVALDAALAPGSERSWTVVFTDPDQRELASIRANGRLPDPLVVSGALVPDGVVRARVRTTMTARIQEEPYPSHLGARSETSLEIPDPAAGG